jgi:hypothetical protein
MLTDIIKVSPTINGSKNTMKTLQNRCVLLANLHFEFADSSCFVGMLTTTSSKLLFSSSFGSKGCSSSQLPYFLLTGISMRAARGFSRPFSLREDEVLLASLVLGVVLSDWVRRFLRDFEAFLYDSTPLLL